MSANYTAFHYGIGQFATSCAVAGFRDGSACIEVVPLAGSPGAIRRDVAVDDSSGLGCCFYILAFFSFLLVIFLFPLSLIWSVKVC